jgi:DNA-binding transcriptional LysR family regulator
MNDVIDRELLVLFVQLLDTGALHRAAARMDVSVPAASRGLQRLRTIFEDKLFVKTATGMTPTPQALALKPRVETALAALDALAAPVRFDPKHSTHRFRLALLDNGIIAALSGLMPAFRQRAPHATLDVSPLGPEVGDQLREGQIDLAVFPREDLPPDCHCQPLLVSEFVCLLWDRHPLTKRTPPSRAPTIDDYLAFPRLSVKTRWGASTRLIEQIAMPDLPEQQPAVVVPYFLGAPLLLPGSDLIAVMPRPTAEGFARILPLTVLPTPLPSTAFRPQLIWHERVHADPAVRWLRELILSLAAGAGARSRAARQQRRAA